MHRERRNRLLVYAKLLFFISIALFSYGLYLDLNNGKDKVIDPIRDVKPIEEEKSSITITTSDGSEVVPGNTITDSTNNNSINNNGSSNTRSNSKNQVVDNSDPNNNLRVEIQNRYDIKILYGSETNGYSVKSGNAIISTNPITDSNKITEELNELNYTLSLYPNGMFSEIKRGGIPLTIILVDSYSENSITGVTDSSNEYAKISIAAAYPFAESFYHESYHYIERYMFKNGANFNSWDSLNPSGFTWNTINGNLSYSNTFSADAPFVNNYAQTAAAEDRASTFEYMMADSKASCLNNGTTVWKKANYMAQMIKQVINSARNSSNVRWERFLY